MQPMEEMEVMMEEEGLFAASPVSVPSGCSYFVIKRIMGDRTRAMQYVKSVWEAVRKRELLYREGEFYLRVIQNSDHGLDMDDGEMFLTGEHNEVLGGRATFAGAVTPSTMRTPEVIFFRLSEKFVFLCEHLDLEELQVQLMGDGLIFETEKHWGDFINEDGNSLDLLGWASQFPILLKNYVSEGLNELMLHVSPEEVLSVVFGRHEDDEEE